MKFLIILIVGGVFLSVWIGAPAHAHAGISANHDVPNGSFDMQWNLYLPVGQSVKFQGVADFDDAGLNTGSMLYPGDNGATFLIAIFTHGALAKSMRDEQKEELQLEADKVLKSYRDILDSFGYEELFSKSLTLMSTQGDKNLIVTVNRDVIGWIVVSEPVFSLSQNQRAIVLDNRVSVYSPNDRSKPAYQNLIHVVSNPIDVEDPNAFWKNNDGVEIKLASAQLLALSLDDAMAFALGNDDFSKIPYRTFRYIQGDVEKIERARLLKATCDRMLLENLRGWLYSVPLSDPTLVDKALACDRQLISDL